MRQKHKNKADYLKPALAMRSTRTARTTITQRKEPQKAGVKKFKREGMFVKKHLA